MLLDRSYHYLVTTSTSGIWGPLGTALPTPAHILLLQTWHSGRLLISSMQVEAGTGALL